MISAEEKLQVLDIILASKAFSKSTTSNILLKYLVESSIDGINLNATNISMELFGTHYEQEKSEATVRVNVYHLRGKLKKYFETEGIEDKIRIEIPTGQYGVTFTRKPKDKPKYSTKQKTILGLILLAVLALGLYSYKKLTYKDPVWHSLFNNDKETTLYLYDVFGYYGPTLFNKIGWHRDYEINSATEFYEALEKQPKLLKDYSPGRNIYVNYLSAYSVKDLSKHFYRYNKEFKIHKFNNLSPQQLKEQNSVYLGPLRSENAFVDFFNLKSKRVKLVDKTVTSSKSTLELFDGQKGTYNESRNVRYIDNSKDIDTIIKLKSDGIRNEYVMVAKLNGDNDTSNLLFFSNHGFGGTAAIEYFTNIDSISSFNENHLKNADEFITLFYVSGKDRTSMNIRQVLFDDNK